MFLFTFLLSSFRGVHGLMASTSHSREELEARRDESRMRREERERDRLEKDKEKAEKDKLKEEKERQLEDKRIRNENIQNMLQLKMMETLTGVLDPSQEQ